jgi:predicted nucleotidyltransferase
MDIFDTEIIRFWKSLQDHQVKFIVVGGYATNLHGYQRFTGDMDIWIEDSIVNRKHLRIAFKEYGMGDFEMMERMQFVPGWTNFHLNNGMQLDIMVGMKGLEGYSFDECLQLASIADIEGVQVPFLHINHLIANKVAVNRPKDQLDVLYLEKIKKLLEDS